jgi:hypothetical protein
MLVNMPGKYGPTREPTKEPLYMEKADGSRILLCGATKKNGERCRSVAGLGTDHLGYGPCKQHGGSTKAHVVKAARQEIVDKLDEMAKLGIVNDFVGPEAALMYEVSRSAASVAYYDAEVSKLRPEELTSSRGQVLINQWNEQRRLLTHTAKIIVAAGIAKRSVEVAEMQAKAMVGAIMAVISAPEMALSPEQQTLARQLIAAQLRQMVVVEG